ncbi:MAG: alginate lyase family protein [Saprospiraceae bacterium]|nr:alginate lyase family protein [Saprospiraceae bacterium]
MNNFLKFGGLILMLILSGCVTAESAWRDLVAIEDLYEAYPETIEEMFSQIDLTHPGLEDVRASFEQGQMVNACANLLMFFRQGTHAAHLRMPLPVKTQEREGEADTILTDVFSIQNVRGKVPFGSDGHRDWHYRGPNNDREWAWLSNRHSQLLHVFDTYQETGNPDYASYIDLFLRDFIIKSMPYPAKKGTDAIWRGLEVAARAKVWSRIFYGMINDPALSPATQLLMLSSLPDHAHYNRNFHGGNNWLTMEISALATVATNFPIYKGAEEWITYSIAEMTKSMKDQVYPDGVQTELTSHYHNVSLRNFELFKKICDRAGRELPGFFSETIRKMYAYIAQAVRPDGYRILNNDGDRGSDRSIILEGAERFGNGTWTYLATNGAEGIKPDDGPSYFFPWAGQLISRSGYDADAHWSFFDIGPWGSGHQHNDKLHISIAAYGRDLLVDAGRFAYTGETAKKFRPYARSSAGHNLILIEGKNQAPGPKLADTTIGDLHYRITPQFDYASHTFGDYLDMAGQVTHTRSILYVRGGFWVVVDKVTSDRPRTVTALWHWHPDCTVEKDGQVVKSKNEKGNLSIMPVGGQEWEVSFIKGQEQPQIQGWYSPEYNIFSPNTTSIYDTRIDGNSTFIWLLVPSEREAPEVDGKVISMSPNEVQLAVRMDQKKWELIIPHLNSRDVSLN